MASTSLEEKIEKIRLQNEKIRQRYEEVEADKKNAAKSNALVQLVPSDDWPERKEPPEFSAPPKNIQRIINRDHEDRPQRSSGIQERLSKREHKYNQGEGPPPDPKYNFLADSERESRSTNVRGVIDDNDRSQNRNPRNPGRRRGGGRDGDFGGQRMGGPGGDFVGNKNAFFRDNRGPNAFCSRDGSVPEYEAWRAERNRIDEARINRQKTAEGNWRREWDCNKVNVEKEAPRREPNKRDSGNHERRNNFSEDNHTNRSYGTSRTYHGTQRSHAPQENRRSSDQFYDKKQRDGRILGPSIDGRSVIATDQSIKVTVNPNNQSKGSVMSVKVNSPNIVGSGRVGPRQKSRISYSSQSDVEVTSQGMDNLTSHASFAERSIEDVSQKPSSKSPFPQRKKRGDPKSSNSQKNEGGLSELADKTESAKSSHPQPKDQRKPRVQRKIQIVTEGRVKSCGTSDNALPFEYCSDKLSGQNLDSDENCAKQLGNVSKPVIEEIYAIQQIDRSSDNLQADDNLIQEKFGNELEKVSSSNLPKEVPSSGHDKKLEGSDREISSEGQELSAPKDSTTDFENNTDHIGNDGQVHHGSSEKVEKSGTVNESGFSHDAGTGNDELLSASLSNHQSNNQSVQDISDSSPSTDIVPPPGKLGISSTQKPSHLEEVSKNTDEIPPDTAVQDSVEECSKDSNVDNHDGVKDILYKTSEIVSEGTSECQVSLEESVFCDSVSEKLVDRSVESVKEIEQSYQGSNENIEIPVKVSTSAEDSGFVTDDKDNTSSDQTNFTPSQTDSNLTLGSEPVSVAPLETESSTDKSSDETENISEQNIEKLESSNTSFANDSGFIDISTVDEHIEDIKKSDSKGAGCTTALSQDDKPKSDIRSALAELGADEAGKDRMVTDVPANSSLNTQEIVEVSSCDIEKSSETRDSINEAPSDRENIELKVNTANDVISGPDKSGVQSDATLKTLVDSNFDSHTTPGITDEKLKQPLNATTELL
ncbi:hypothetical protein QAD02_001003 [Eretmocerus hayati]|uniref:Uncharacterized protein n=1 Tax=Eretmocerus hayati TaxID=131215 RepID=A0ACC2NES1_9HYME|nr:hypothetical protein QAD02_001003 [Eretmocerus hayati]